jgi:hypothetical protein
MAAALSASSDQQVPPEALVPSAQELQEWAVLQVRLDSLAPLLREALERKRFGRAPRKHGARQWIRDVAFRVDVSARYLEAVQASV